MNKKLIIAAALSLMTITSCGKAGVSSESKRDPKFSEKKTTVSTYEKTTEAQEPTEEITYVPLHDEDGVSAEESMRVDKIKMKLKPDEDGFLIKDGVLYDYDGVSSEVHIPEGVTKIESRAFWGNDIVTAVYIPSSVKEIGNGAFWSCSALTYVDIEEGLESIKDTAFWSCSGLNDVNLPASVSEIYSSVFWSIDDLKIHAPKGCYAQKFAEHNGIEYDCERTEYNKENRKNHIRARQYAYGEFTEFTIEENIEAIESNAFEYCEKLESITIPGNVKKIAAEAFEYCKGLKLVRIEEGCEEIGASAFAYCRGLKDVYLPASAKNISKRAFEYCDENLTLHVPEGSYAEEYATAMNIPFDNNMG